MKVDGRMYKCDLCGRLLFVILGKSINHECFIERINSIEMVIVSDTLGDFARAPFKLDKHVENKFGWATCTGLGLPGDGLICPACKEKIVKYIVSEFEEALIYGIDNRRNANDCEESISGGLVENESTEDE